MQADGARKELIFICALCTSLAWHLLKLVHSQDCELAAHFEHWHLRARPRLPATHDARKPCSVFHLMEHTQAGKFR